MISCIHNQNYQLGKGAVLLKLIIDQSVEHKDVEITIKCGLIDEDLERLIAQIRLLSFSIIGKKDGVYHIPLKHTIDALAVIDRCRANIASIEIISGTMDDVFINLTGTEVRYG
jgi:hypothetical protein